MSGFGKVLPSIPSKPVTPPVIYYDHSAELIAEAKKWIGTKESGNNGGAQVNAFQKCVGLSTGDSWCMAFDIYCVLAVAKEHGLIPLIVTDSGGCLDVWHRSPKSSRSFTPEPGFLIIYQHGNTEHGHTGIVVGELGDGTLVTVEGNTGPEDHVNANGDGVWLKHRNPKGQGDMHVLGFLRPF